MKTIFKFFSTETREKEACSSKRSSRADAQQTEDSLSKHVAAAAYLALRHVAFPCRWAAAISGQRLLRPPLSNSSLHRLFSWGLLLRGAPAVEAAVVLPVAASHVTYWVQEKKRQARAALSVLGKDRLTNQSLLFFSCQAKTTQI